jgi:hypothetical protein
MYLREIRINGKDHMIRSKHSEAKLLFPQERGGAA